MIVTMLTDFLLGTSVLLHWLLRSMGKTMPCFVVFWVSYAGESMTCFDHIRERLICCQLNFLRILYAETHDAHLWVE